LFVVKTMKTPARRAGCGNACLSAALLLLGAIVVAAPAFPAAAVPPDAGPEAARVKEILNKVFRR